MDRKACYERDVSLETACREPSRVRTRSLSKKSGFIVNADEAVESDIEVADPLAIAILGVFFLFVAFMVMMPLCFTWDDVFKEKPPCGHPVLPYGVVFAVGLILIFGNLAAYLVERFLHLPGLLGMLCSGYVLRNFVPGALDGMSTSINSKVRTMALGIIMVRAGMGLDLVKLKEQWRTLSFLSCVPCCGEAITIALFSMVIFDDVPVSWALMLGFVIADVSPAVTTPLLLEFNVLGYGRSKGIPSILMAAGSVNSVVAIVLYSIMWEFSWGEGVGGAALVEIIALKLIVQIFVVGLGVGWAVGYVSSFVWQRCSDALQRFGLVFFVCMALLFGWARAGYSGGGTLAALSFGASLQHYVDSRVLRSTAQTQDMIGIIWKRLGSVLLFTLLGASIDQSKLKGTIIGGGVLLIIIGLAGRGLVTFLSVLPIKNWTTKEKLFAVITWCPKATVQAALASKAMDHIKEQVATKNPSFSDEKDVAKWTKSAEIILTVAVLSIIMTAPTFAVAMAKTAPHLLTCEDDPIASKDLEDSKAPIGKGASTGNSV